MDLMVITIRPFEGDFMVSVAMRLPGMFHSVTNFSRMDGALDHGTGLSCASVCQTLLNQYGAFLPRFGRVSGVLGLNSRSPGVEPVKWYLSLLRKCSSTNGTGVIGMKTEKPMVTLYYLFPLSPLAPEVLAPSSNQQGQPRVARSCS